MCNGAEENQAHCCDPYGLRVQEQPLFLVCSSITIFTSMGLDPYTPLEKMGQSKKIVLKCHRYH